jgi:hypothetical protein
MVSATAWADSRAGMSPSRRLRRRAAAGGDGNNFGTQQAHAEDIEALAAHILFTHVDDTFQAEESTDSGRSHAMLAGAGFGDDALLTHAASEEPLAEAVVYFVCAGVEEIFAFEVDAGAPEVFGEAAGEVERGRAAGIVGEQVRQFRLKGRVVAGSEISQLELFDRGHEHFGHKAAAIRSEVAAGVRQRRNHAEVSKAALTKAAILV